VAIDQCPPAPRSLLVSDAVASTSAGRFTVPMMPPEVRPDRPRERPIRLRSATGSVGGGRHARRSKVPVPPDGSGMSLHGKSGNCDRWHTGIGKAVVLALAKEGADIVIDYIAQEEAEAEVEAEVKALGDRVVGVKADVSKVEDLRTLVNTAVSTFGRLDIMVNNAGIETRTSVLDTTEEEYEKVLDINLKSAFFGTQLAATR